MSYTLERKKSIVEGSKSFAGTIEEYCLHNNLSRSSFYKWKRQLNNADSSTPIFVDVTDKIKKSEKNSFESYLTVCVNELSILVGSNYDETLLLKLVSSLKKL